MNYKARSLAFSAATALILSACAGGPGEAAGDISGDRITLGVITDLSGQLKPTTGPGSVEAVKMAVADFKAKYGDKAVTKNIKVLAGDHQNKPDVANTVARQFYDRDQADVILDVPNSAAALAVATVAKQMKRSTSTPRAPHRN